jgi:hypothetical protein
MDGNLVVGRRRLIRFAGFGLAAVVLSACGITTASQSTKTGMIVGRLMI